MATRDRDELETRAHENGRARRPGQHGPPPRRPSYVATHRPRKPSRGPVMTQLMRLIGLTATGMLLAVGVAVVLMVTRDNGTDPPETFAAPAATPKPAAKKPDKRARPRGPRLTNAQRASRDAAVTQLRSQGFEPVALADYKPRQSLRVLIGRPKASTGLRGRRAFFFVREEYLGTDAAEPSLRVRVLRQRDGVVTLNYTLFSPGDKPSKPTGGNVRVRFTVADGRLIPEDPLPPVASRLPPS
jgi:LppP/LprE lipoprotein